MNTITLDFARVAGKIQRTGWWDAGREGIGLKGDIA